MCTRLLSGVVFVCLLAVSASAQTTSPASPPVTSDPQAVALIQKALAALTGGAPPTDVTMTGTFTMTAGANTDTGTVTLVATSAGRSQTSVTTAAGTRTEIRDISGGWPTLTVISTDGVAHAVATQSALVPHPATFYLPFVLMNGLSSGIYASSYVGQENWNGTPAEHVAIWLVPGPTWAGTPQDLQRITKHDIYLC